MNTRRNWFLALSVMCFTFFLAGCAGTWVSESQSIIGLLVPAVGSALALIGAFSGNLIPPDLLSKITTIAASVQTDLNNVVVPLLAQYDAAPATDRAGILRKIDQALQQIMSNWTTLLPQLHIDNPAVKAKVEAVVGAVDAELQSLIALIPALTAAQAHAGPDGKIDMTRLINAVHATGHDLPLTSGQFKKTFNALMKTHTGDDAADEKSLDLLLK